MSKRLADSCPLINHGLESNAGTPSLEQYSFPSCCFEEHHMIHIWWSQSFQFSNILLLLSTPVWIWINLFIIALILVNLGNPRGQHSSLQSMLLEHNKPQFWRAVVKASTYHIYRRLIVDCKCLSSDYRSHSVYLCMYNWLKVLSVKKNDKWTGSIDIPPNKSCKFMQKEKLWIYI